MIFLALVQPAPPDPSLVADAWTAICTALVIVVLLCATAAMFMPDEDVEGWDE